MATPLTPRSQRKSRNRLARTLVYVSSLILIVILGTVACSTIEPDDPGTPTPQLSCDTGKRNPITPAMLRAVLRRHGLTVWSLKHDNWCAPGRTVLSNQRAFSIKTDETVYKYEGWYVCLLEQRSSHKGFESNLDHAANSTIAGSKHAEWELENLSCSLYPSSNEHWDEQIHGLDEALIELARSTRARPS